MQELIGVVFGKADCLNKRLGVRCRFICVKHHHSHHDYHDEDDDDDENMNVQEAIPSKISTTSNIFSKNSSQQCVPHLQRNRNRVTGGKIY